MSRRWLLSAVLAIAAVAGGFWVTQQGLRTCGWLDRAIGHSGCLGTLSVDGVIPGRGNPDVPFTAEGHAILAVEIATADGWRNALFVFDPVDGEERGRYPVPMRNTTMRLFPAPDGKSLLLLCGIIESGCTETGGNGVLVDRASFQAFTDLPDVDRHIRTFPGNPLPDTRYGFEARFAAKGERIVTERRNEGVMLLDAAGKPIATLSTRSVFSSKIVISPDGMRILRWQPGYGDGNGDLLHIWDATDGRELGRIDGGPGWKLRAPPFWSPDGKLIFTPRRTGRTMLLDRFEAP